MTSSPAQTRSAPVLRWGIAGVAVINLGQVGRFLDFCVSGAAPAEQWRMIAAVAVFLPVETYLLVAAVRNVRPRLAWLLLATVALPIAALLPVSDNEWTLMLSVLFGLALIYFRPPVSPVLAGLVIALTVASALAISRFDGGAGMPSYLGARAQFAVLDVMDTVWVGLALAVLVWLIRMVRELDAARRQLAARAVVIERQRIDEEVERTVGAALERIAARGELAGALARSAPGLAAGELTAITARSRATLAEARGMLTGYREVSAQAELAAAVTLLSAGGVSATLVLPDEGLPGYLPERARSLLRTAVARALADAGLRDCVLTVKVVGDGDLSLCIRAAQAGTAAPACQDAAA